MYSEVFIMSKIKTAQLEKLSDMAVAFKETVEGFCGSFPELSETILNKARPTETEKLVDVASHFTEAGLAALLGTNNASFFQTNIEASDFMVELTARTVDEALLARLVSEDMKDQGVINALKNNGAPRIAQICQTSLMLTAFKNPAHALQA